MNKLPTLYKKPFIVSAVFILVALTMIFIGGFFDFGDLSYAIIIFGGLFLITGVVTICVYGMMEKRFKQALGDINGILLHYEMNENEFIKGVSQQADNIKSTNKSTLLIMLGFCVILAIAGPFFLEDGIIFSITAIVLGVFLTIMALIITNYRTNKLKKGKNEILLTINASYAFGELHSWQLPGFLLSVEYCPREQNNKYNCDVIEIKYTAVAMPIQIYDVTLPIPSSMESDAHKAVINLKSKITIR